MGIKKFDMANLLLKKAGILLPLQRTRLCGTFRAEWTDRCKRREIRHACKTIHLERWWRVERGGGGVAVTDLAKVKLFFRWKARCHALVAV
jgi:hypothetical protein